MSIFYSICAVLCIVFLHTCSIAQAASWQWSNLPNRERITIQLDTPDQNTNLSRTGTQKLELPLQGKPTVFNNTGTAPQGNLLADIKLNESTLELELKTPAFGYIITKPTPNRVVIDLYSDPLGARWKAEGGLIPANSVGLLNPVVTSNITNTTTTSNITNSTIDIQPEENLSTSNNAIAQNVSPVVTNITADIMPSPAALAALANQSNVTAELTLPALEPTLPEVQPDMVTNITQPEVQPDMVKDITQNDTENTPTDAQLTLLPPIQAPAPTELENTMPALRETAEPYYGHAFTAKLSSAAYDSPEAIPQPEQVLGANDISSPIFKASINKGGPEDWNHALSVPQDAITNYTQQNESIQGNHTAVENALNNISQNNSNQSVLPTPVENQSTDTAENTTIDNVSTNISTNISENVTAKPLTLDEAKALGKTILYVDAEGNEVPPPPDIPELINQMRDLMRRNKYAEAIVVMDQLKPLPLDKDIEIHKTFREELLYNYLTALYKLNEADPSRATQALVSAAQEAMNFNLKSSRVPEAMSLLATVHLASGNQEDAQGYIMLLKRLHPTYPNVPALILKLGDDQMAKGQYSDAAKSFNMIVQDYPESKTAKDAARLEALAYYKQGHYDKALPLIEFVKIRWPRIYLETPDFLPMTADVQIHQGKLDDALDTLWLQYNLDPKADIVPELLNKIAELYYTIGNTEGATKVGLELVDSFPDSPYAPIALLRIGENRLYEPNPSLDNLIELFSMPNVRIPSIYYQQILDNYPNSLQAIDAKVRLAAWHYKNKNFREALKASKEVMEKYPEYPQFLTAQDILLRSFAQDLGMALAEENFERVLQLWENYPAAQDYYQPLEPDLRVALARAYLNRGDEQTGMDILSPFIDFAQDPKYGLYVYNLFLAQYLKNNDWNAILDLGEKVNSWEMPLDVRNQHDYTMALSAENLGLSSTALPLWQKLAPNTSIPLYQRAYATYFLARDAEKKQDLRAAYQYNLDALAMFEQLQDERSPYADSERLRESTAALMDITEIAGRLAESLEWVNRYSRFVPLDSPDYSGLRFREARLHRKMGDMNRWRVILEDIVKKEPESVFGTMAASELKTEKVARDLNRFLN